MLDGLVGDDGRSVSDGVTRAVEGIRTSLCIDVCYSTWDSNSCLVIFVIDRIIQLAAFALFIDFIHS